MTFFYIFIASTIFFSFLAQKKNSKFCLLLAIVSLTLVIGCRGESVGIDTKNYYQQFNLIMKGSQFVAIKEVVFAFITKEILTAFGENWVAIFIYSAVIVVCILLRLWDYRKDVNFGILVVFFLCFHLTASMNIMRQYVSTAIIFYFSRYLEKNKTLVFIIGTLLAICIHYSGIIGLALLPFYIFVHKGTKKRVEKLIFIVMTFIPLALVVWLSLGEQYSFYLSNEGSSFGIGLIAKIFVLVLFYFLSVRRQPKGEEKEKVVYLIIICFVASVLSSLGYFFKYMDRLSLLFKLFEMPLYGYMIKSKYKVSLDRNGIIKINLYKILIGVLFIYCFYSSFISDAHGILPYVPFWEGIA